MRCGLIPLAVAMAVSSAVGYVLVWCGLTPVAVAVSYAVGYGLV